MYYRDIVSCYWTCKPPRDPGLEIKLDVKLNVRNGKKKKVGSIVQLLLHINYFIERLDSSSTSLKEKEKLPEDFRKLLVIISRQTNELQKRLWF